MGQPIYSAVDASVVNGGIMTMEASGGGQTETGLWLNWDASSGFTGGWVLWDALQPYIENTGWTTFSKEVGYESTFKDFKDFLENENPTNLDKVLADEVWSNKSDFITTYWKELTQDGVPGPGKCLTLVG